jgi:hypothetical protein
MVANVDQPRGLAILAWQPSVAQFEVMVQTKSSTPGSMVYTPFRGCASALAGAANPIAPTAAATHVLASVLVV